MNKRTNIVISLVIAASAAVAGYLISVKLNGPEANKASTRTIPVAALDTRRPDFTLPDLEGRKRSISEWDGKVILLNFWATWCPPCRREMPAFIKLQEKYGKQGFQVIGIAIDQKDLAEQFADSIGVNYPILAGQLEATEITKRYGNHFGQLPYTVFIDRKGIIRVIKRGEVKHAWAEKVIQRLLKH